MYVVSYSRRGECGASVETPRRGVSASLTNKDEGDGRPSGLTTIGRDKERMWGNEREGGEGRLSRHSDEYAEIRSSRLC